jgi:hypothetical protein
MTLHVRVIVPRFVFTARETEDGTLILAANLPGVRDSLKVTIQGRGLTVSTDEFSRDFAVGHEYDLDKIETKYEDGVLTVTVPPAPARVITFREQAKPLDQIEAKAVTKAPDQIEAGIVNPVPATA